MISGAADCLLKLNRAHGRGLIHDLDFIVLGKVSNDDVEHETVQLRFRQWIRSFQFNGILRGQYIKWRIERIGMTFNRDRSLLHGFQQAPTASWEEFG